MMLQLEHDCMKAIDKVFPIAVRKQIANLMKDAYRTRNKWMNDSGNFLDTKIGTQDLPAHLLRAAIEYEANNYCKKGLLPFKCHTIANTAKNCHHVEMYNDNYKIYFVRAAYEFEKPGSGIKQALYRPGIEIDLFNPVNQDSQEQFEPPTFYITYGDYSSNSLKFVNIGVPGEKSWLYLKHLSLEEASISPVREQKDEQLLVTLINEDGAKNENAK